MKKLLFIAFMGMFLYSCSPSSSSSVTPTVAPNYYFVKYWKTDTFKNDLSAIATDSFYSFKHGDTSGIIYAGTTLYVFGSTLDTTSGAIYGYIGTAFGDTASAWSKGYIYPYKHWHASDNQMNIQKQAILFSNRAPHFATTGSSWYTGR